MLKASYTQRFFDLKCTTWGKDARHTPHVCEKEKVLRVTFEH